MPKTSTDLTRHVLNGPTMGTRWSAVFFAESDFDAGSFGMPCRKRSTRWDGLMSTWKPETALMRFNAAPANVWLRLPDTLLEVMEFGLEVGRQSEGAFDIGWAMPSRPGAFARRGGPGGYRGGSCP